MAKKVAVLGYGVVGSGVCEVIRTNAASISKKIEDELEVKYILDIKKIDPSDLEFSKITSNFDLILNDDEIRVVAEVMGGATYAYEFTKALLEKGKNVVTSNKELVAKHGTELLKIAKDKGVNYLFEASVGGGIPIIRPLYSCLVANEITKITGILNGTTNYILTKMFKEGMDFSTVLKEAQQKGYAEANPAADVEGYDACRKIAILGSLVFGKRVDFNLIKTVGITNITADDVSYADKLDSVIKLIGQAEMRDGRVYASLEPRIVKNGTPLANIDGVFNGIMVNGNAIGEVVFYGPGAGKLPTASAVVADIIDSVRNIDKNRAFYWEDAEADFIAPAGENEGEYLLIVNDENLPALAEKISYSETVKIKPNETGVITTTVSEASIEKIEKIEKISGIIKKYIKLL